jgi:hypothetical protein
MKNDILIIDLNAPRRFGHFESFNTLLSESVAQSGIGFDFRTFGVNQSWNVKLAIIQSDLATNKYRHVFFTWLHDLKGVEKEIDLICSTFDISYSGLASVSHAFRKTRGLGSLTARRNSFHVVKMVQASKSCKNILTWDPGILAQSDYQINFHFLPDYQSTTINLDAQPLLPKEQVGYVLKVGLVGQLYPYRGLQNIYKLAKRNSNVIFYLIGKRSDFYSGIRYLYENYLWWRVERLKNSRIIEGYVDSDNQLNQYINELDAIYLDTKSYPNPSGIVCKARCLGKRVLITSSNSALLDIYRGDPELILIKNRTRGLLDLVPKDRAQPNCVLKVDAIKAIENFFIKMVKEKAKP